MSPELTAAIYGASAGALIFGLIELFKWQFNRRALKKAIQIGLYYEIDNHKITEISKDSDGQPDLYLSSFQDNFYSNNIAAITKLLDEKFIQHLTFYYSNLLSVINHQSELSDLHSKLEKITAKLPETETEVEKFRELEKEHEDIKHYLRMYLVPSLNTKQVLFMELKKVFKNDPSERTYISVPKEYKDWWTNYRIKKTNHEKR